MADDTFVMNVDNQHEEVVLNQGNKEFSSAKKNAFTTPNLHERPVLQSSNYNLGVQIEGRDFHLQNKSGINHPTNFMNLKKLITDKNQKLFNESTLQAIQYVLQRKRNYGIYIIIYSDENHQIMRNELVHEYMKIEQLVEEAINNINLIKEGDHVKIIKKNIFQISKTRQPSPTRSEDDLVINKAMEQKFNSSILVQGTGPEVLGPISYMKLKKQNFQRNQESIKLDFYPFRSRKYVLHEASISKPFQALQERWKQFVQNRRNGIKSSLSHFKRHDSNSNFLAKKSHVQYTHLTLEDSSQQMPSISNSIYNPNSSIMVQDGLDKTQFQLHSNQKGKKTGFPLIQSKKIE